MKQKRTSNRCRRRQTLSGKHSALCLRLPTGKQLTKEGCGLPLLRRIGVTSMQATYYLVVDFLGCEYFRYSSKKLGGATGLALFS